MQFVSDAIATNYTALEKAVQSAVGGASHEDIVTAAKHYRAFLLGHETCIQDMIDSDLMARFNQRGKEYRALGEEIARRAKVKAGVL